VQQKVYPGNEFTVLIRAAHGGSRASPAPKERKNAAHGASRGKARMTAPSPGGAEENRHATPLDRFLDLTVSKNRGRRQGEFRFPIWTLTSALVTSVTAFDPLHRENWNRLALRETYDPARSADTIVGTSAAAKRRKSAAHGASHG
jgi:hypothetical protein